MESGRSRPEGDVEGLRYLSHRKVEVVVERDDGTLVDVEPAELGHHPFAIGDISRCVRGPYAVRGRDDPDLDLRALAFLLRESVARAHGEPPQPGVPGVGVTQCAHVLPGGDERLLHRILGAIGIAQDEVGDSVQPRCSRPHQLGEGVRIPALGLFDQVSLHRCHRYGAGSIPAHSYSRGLHLRVLIPGRGETRADDAAGPGLSPSGGPISR